MMPLGKTWENKTYIPYLCWTYDCISKVRRKLPPKPSYLQCLWKYDIYWYILSDGQKTNVSLGPQKVKTRTKSICSTCSIYKFHQISVVLSHLPSAALILMRFGLHQGTDPWCSRLKRKWCKERSPNLNHCHRCTPHLPVHVGGIGHIHCQVCSGFRNRQWNNWICFFRFTPHLLGPILARKQLLSKTRRNLFLTSLGCIRSRPISIVVPSTCDQAQFYFLIRSSFSMGNRSR